MKEKVKNLTINWDGPDYFSNMKHFFVIFSTLLFVYMLWPGPSKISDFKELPNSDKSTLEGDTIQIPNVAGYFSNNYRDFTLNFYTDNYQRKSNFPFPPLRLNHPPEYAWIAIKRHTDTTYLEELVYPLRDSLYVNGLEPYYEGGIPKFWGATMFEIGSNNWFTKVTIRYYPSNIFARFFVWFGICVSIFWVYKLGRKILI